MGESDVSSQEINAVEVRFRAHNLLKYTGFLAEHLNSVLLQIGGEGYIYRHFEAKRLLPSYTIKSGSHLNTLHKSSTRRHTRKGLATHERENEASVRRTSCGYLQRVSVEGK